MNNPPRSANVLANKLLEPGVLDQVKAKPQETVRKLAEEATRELPPPPLVFDKLIYRIVVGSLGLVSILAVIGAIYLSAIAPSTSTPNIPDTLTALGAAAIGALAGLLAPAPKSG